jgi:hypothetical protein
MIDKHTKTKKGILCPSVGELEITEWPGIGYVYEAPLYQQIIHDSKCPECKETISYVLPSRESSTDENLALDLLIDEPENGC